ncbi:hypothetical protein OG887_06810 [Streptomyces sp. NBC_00053]|uniref:hypothetical protein n=1 Tax=Streptomyces sp. NBC_00053 TaxID=2975631 RepID=UPI0022563BAA|nr:hypothetical protein [Streptomyces sp. NBC_00052]MCX5552366.1 hypothetical protein [Streptomyces sp. NBC_00051]
MNRDASFLAEQATQALVADVVNDPVAYVEVVDHVPNPGVAGGQHLGDIRHRHALRGQRHHLGSPPGHR